MITPSSILLLMGRGFLAAPGTLGKTWAPREHSEGRRMKAQVCVYRLGDRSWGLGKGSFGRMGIVEPGLQEGAVKAKAKAISCSWEASLP